MIRFVLPDISVSLMAESKIGNSEWEHGILITGMYHFIVIAPAKNHLKCRLSKSSAAYFFTLFDLKKVMGSSTMFVKSFYT